MTTEAGRQHVAHRGSDPLDGPAPDVEALLANLEREGTSSLELAAEAAIRWMLAKLYENQQDLLAMMRERDEALKNADPQTG